MALAAIRVTLIKSSRPDGTVSSYPDFRALNGDSRLQGLKVGEYIDIKGSGFCHDRLENQGTGHAQGTAMAMVPDWLADELVAMHPTRVSKHTEADFATFHDTRHIANMPGILRDVNILSGLKAERDLRVAMGHDVAALDVEIAAALDADSPMPGVLRNPVAKPWSEKRATPKIQAKIRGA